MRPSRRPLESSWLSQITLGSGVPAKTAAYLSAFGHTSRAAPTLSMEASRRLYGIDSPASQIVMSPPGLNGEIRIVATSNKPHVMQPYQSGIHGIDFYTSDVGHSRAVAAAAGGLASPLVPYAAGTISILESRILSPDRDFAVFISEVNNRPFPSALDIEPDRQYSDLVTVVAFVDEKHVSAETKFWTETAGLELFRKDLEFDDDDMQRLMDLPAKARMGAVQFCDRDRRRRLELLFYRGIDAPQPAGPGLHPGFHSISFPVDDLTSAIEGFPEISFTQPCKIDFGHGETWASTATSPAGIHFELYQSAVN